MPTIAGVQALKARVFEAFHGASRTAYVVSAAIGLVIVSNVIAIMAETVPGFEERHAIGCRWFERCSLLFFAVEYLLRLWCTTLDPRYARPLLGRIRYAITPMALIDLAVLLPAILPLFLPVDLRALRVLRMVRILRLLRIPHYSTSLQRLRDVVHARRGDLSVAAVLLGVLMVACSTLMYYAEHDANPVRFSSIPATMWWAVITLTTVGYGDVYPITTAGKVIAGLTAILGVGIFTLPAGIIASGFITSAQGAQARAPARCPRCGLELDGSHLDGHHSLASDAAGGAGSRPPSAPAGERSA
jgi:voltage-gated potassium channel